MDIEPYTPPSLNVIHCVTVKLTEQNFIFWKRQFQSFLSGQRLYGFVTGSMSQPVPTIMAPSITGVATPVPNPDHELWVQTDQVVQSWLLGSLSEQLQSVVLNCVTSCEIWQALEKHFNRPSNSRMFELQLKLQTLNKSSKKMADYLTEIKNLSDQLASIGNPISETMKIFSALRGLGREYEPIKTTIENTMDNVPSPSFEDITPKLVSFDERLQSYASNSEVSPHLAFSSVQMNQEQAFYSSRGRHYRGRRGGYRGRGSSFSTRGRGFHQQISSPRNSDSDSRPVCQICGKPGHPALRCYHRFDFSYHDDVPQALAAMRITDVSDSEGADWYSDSGATAHVTSSPQHLQHSQPYYGSDTVMVGDSNFLPITHTGSTSIATTSGNLPLTDVLVCPGIAKSLLSVSKATSDYPCSFKFDDNGGTC